MHWKVCSLHYYLNKKRSKNLKQKKRNVFEVFGEFDE